MFAYLVKIYPALYGILTYIAQIAKARHWSLSSVVTSSPRHDSVYFVITVQCIPRFLEDASLLQVLGLKML